MSKKGPNHLIQAALSRECGHFSKMYNALYECCGGGLNARSIATVWTAIIDRTASEEIAGKLVNDGGKNWIVFNDGYWLLRLRMSRPTMKGALDWLEGAGVLEVKKEKKGQGYPTRYVALVPGTLETIIGEIRGKGGPVEDLEYPLLMSDGVLLPPSEAAPLREDLRREKAPKNGIQLRPEDRGKGLTKGRQRSYKRSSKDTPTKCKESSDQMQEVLPTTVRGLTAKSSLEEITEDIEKGFRDDFSQKSDTQQMETEALTRLSQATAINTRQEKTSFDFPGNSAQQLKPSATKEIEEAPATEPNDSRKEEVRAAPSCRITVQDAAAGLKELCEVEEGPWAVPSDYALQSVVSRVLRLGWTYAVRHMVFNRDLRGFETPLDTWPILGEESLPSPAQIHALVQAAIDANNGEDPWPAVNGHQDTNGFPKFSDTRFNRAYHRRLEELENAV